MGNSQSHDEAKSPPASRHSNQQQQQQQQQTQTQRDGSREKERSGAGRRGQSQSHASTKLTTPPTAIVPSSSSASTSTTNAHAHATVSRSPTSARTRARSVTASKAQQPPGHEPTPSYKSEGSAAMGNIESRNRPPSRSATLPLHSLASEDSPTSSSSPLPVDIPTPLNHDGLNENKPLAAPPAALPSPLTSDSPGPYGHSSTTYGRPPRLPLPIEEELHTPGSPILTSQDFNTPLDVNGVEGAIPRRTSVLSSTTVDDEDVGDNDAFALEANSLAPTVPTTIEWKGAGEKIYVTGTFVNWERKFKLHKNADHGGFTTVLQLKPGTHHIKFLMDGDMVTSVDLPTTVDYTNILVNYIEVVAPPLQAEVQLPAPAEPMPIPGTALSAGQITPGGEAVARVNEDRSDVHGSEMEADLASTLGENLGTSSRQPSVSDEPMRPSSLQYQTSQTQPKPTTAPPKQKLPRPKYTDQLPDYLYDLDVYTSPGDERHQRVNRVIGHLPQPPSLPMFMSKSILNGTTPHKDDASVLIMPNHTVLNHLATSSIKSGVLATSGTTRYKRKFLTTIMYKPTSDDG